MLAGVPIKIVDGDEIATLDWQGQTLDVYAGRWMIQFDGYSGYLLDQQAQAKAELEGNGSPFQVAHHMAADGMFLITAPKTWTADQVVTSLTAAHRGVTVLGPDIRYELALTPNDTQFNSLWGMNNTGQTGGIVDADIDAPEGWNTSTGSSSVVIGVVDTGIDYNHVDLNDNIFTNTLETPGNGLDDDGNGFIDDIRGWDFFSNDNDPMDVNSSSHGTHVSGTIGAEGNNATGVVGVNWDVTLIGMKIGSTGSGVSGAAAVSSMNYLLSLKNRPVQPVNIKATNHSWGGGGFDGSMNNAIANHNAAGILTVCAAGNNGSNNDSAPFYPATYNQPNVISVGNLTASNARNLGSNFGQTTVDLFAPGTSIQSTMRNNTYGQLTGTSMASPHVTGIVALLSAVAPGGTNLAIRTAILNGVETVASLATLCVTGGRADLDGGIAQLAALPAIPSTPDLAPASDTGASNTDNITNDNTPTFNGTGTIGATIRIYADGVEVGNGLVNVSGNWSVTTSALTDGVRQMTARAQNGAGTSGPSPALPVTIDTVAPTINSPNFAFSLSPHTIGLPFSENVSASLADADLEVTNLDTSANVPAQHTYIGGANTALVTFTGVPVLPSADYDIRIRLAGAGGGVQDVAGNNLADFAFPFFFQMGDANHDRNVNLADFNILAANFGQSPRDFTQGDFDYNLSVGLSDFNLLAANFGAVLTAGRGGSTNPFGGGGFADDDEGGAGDLLA
jgi:subtilisin family serine protease